MSTGQSKRRLSYAHLFLITIVTAVACSGTRRPAPTSTPAAPAPRSDSWLCASSPQAISLETLGVPADHQPVALALAPEKVTVLIRPARLVTLPRGNPQVVDMIVGGSGDSWRAIDRDPTDGSLWVASEENVSLLRIAETGERTVVAGPRVEGRGGFSQIRIARDAIYATPTGSASAVWRLSREGKLLAQSFPRGKGEEPDVEKQVYVVEGEAPGGFWLARDFDGNVVGFDRLAGRFYRANADGAWESLPDRVPALLPSRERSLHGEAVGTSSESWYFTNVIQGFFFLPGGPVFLGSHVVGRRTRGSTLFRIKDGRIETAVEYCAGSGLLIAVSDRSGFAAVSGRAEQIESSGAHRILPPQLILGRFDAGIQRLRSDLP